MENCANGFPGYLVDYACKISYIIFKILHVILIVLIIVSVGVINVIGYFMDKPEESEDESEDEGNTGCVGNESQITGIPLIQDVEFNWRLNQILNSNSHTLVLFFLPWCSFSQEALQVFVETANNLASILPKTHWVLIDCDRNPSIGDNHGIRSFPTIQYFKPIWKIPLEYNGNRTIPDLTNFIRQARHSNL